MNPIARLLCELIEIPSINPGLCEDRPEITGESRIAQFLEERGVQAGLDVTRQQVFPGRDNLLVRLPAKGKMKRRFILAPHLDTVPVKEEGQLRAEVKDNRIYGRGACDTKGCVATYFHVLLELAEQGKLPNGTELLFVGLVDEECNQMGSREFARLGPKGDLAIVGEPTELELITAHKGNLWLELSVAGRAAHGAEPQQGESAIHKMAGIVEVLLTTYAKDLAQKSHQVLGSPTINIGCIRGGTQPNIVPDSCIIQIDRRTIPGETAESILKGIRTALGRNGLDAGTIVEMRGVPCLPLETDPNLKYVQQLLSTTGRTRTCGVNYFSDASPISQGGTPAVLFGPGSIAQAHRDKEWINWGQLELAAGMLKCFLENAQ
jgi:acetylornithine deacetylase/succinyl-diaminopimelate desuccinylase-like protein